MTKTGSLHPLFIAISLLSISLNGTAYAVHFDARDTRVDLPVLQIPNNAISPDISVDKSGHIYVIWSDSRSGSPMIYANSFLPEEGWRSDATPITSGFPREASTPLGDATSPRICSDGLGHVYAVWVDNRAVKAGTGGRDIYFRYSKDFGLTWYPEFTDERLDTDTPKIGDSINPQISCDGNGNVYVVWEDNRNSPRTYEIYFRSLQVQFNTPTDFIVYHQTPDIRLNTGVEAGRFGASMPAIATDKGGNVYVAWQDNRNVPEESIYPGIYSNTSKNHGSTWSPGATQIDRAPIGGFLFFSAPVLCSDSGGNVYAAWVDNGGRAARGEEFAADGTSDVYFNRSSDHGATWDEEDKRIERTWVQATAREVDIACNSRGMVGIVWADNSMAAKFVDPNYNIFFNHSEDFGRTFLDSESNIRIDTGVSAGTTNASSPSIEIDDMGNIFVVWVDNRGGTSDIYFNFSVEKGKTGSWQTPDFRLDYPLPPGNSLSPVMAIDNLGHVYVAWQDDRSALAKDHYNIYYISGFLDVETLLIAGQRLGEACFIATAAYGTPFARNVELLRKFRDRYLLTNSPGRGFVSLYYRMSPPVAHFIAEHDYLKPAARGALLPAVGVAALFLYSTPAQKIALIFIVGAIGGAVSFVVLKGLRGRK